MKKINTQLIQKIKRLMNKNDMTQRELAKRLDKSPSVISNWLQQRHQPSLDDIELMEKVFGEKIIQWANGEDQTSQADKDLNYEELNNKIENLSYTLTTLIRNISDLIQNNSEMIKNNTDFSTLIAAAVISEKGSNESIEKCKKIAEETNNKYIQQFIENNLAVKA